MTPAARLSPRLAALFAGALALAACASAAERKAEETSVREKEKSEKAAADEVNPRGKAALYRRITLLTDQWMQARTGSAVASADEARALETAIAREVWEKFDEVVEDLGTSDNPRWRIAAARGLGFINNPRVRPALEGALEDADASVLAAALVSLGIGASADTDDVRVARLLSYPDKVIAGGAALCLAHVFESRRQQGIPVLAAARVANVESDLQESA